MKEDPDGISLLVAGTMSFMDGELHFSVGVMRTRRTKLG